ncbi:hypothetical protein MKD41_08520 [Lutibacter sp. A64]|uniref:hypothetical protein n=1 Tax=Lutibacter sp. A64 TaxID=2918526 RepID=UPI001F05463E|nr:hypothetical protein [Lutibacter sp. A64]UMB52385.1 hypothetical protein MKD41_08520 [Lutibacter sp. A64]
MKSTKKKYLFYESILAILIITIPYLLYFHVQIPENLTEYDTVFGTINAGYFETLDVYIYYIFSKFVPLFLLTLLYITHSKWWSHALIIPIATYLFQLISILNDGLDYFDETEFIYTLPIMVVVIVPLYFIRKNISIYIAATNLKKEMDDKINKVS